MNCMVAPYPSREELEKYFDYDQEEGQLRWKQNVSFRARKGMVAGSTVKQGYVQVTLNGRILKVHRICYILEHKVDPLDQVIWHKDRDKANNQPDNLIAITRSEMRVMSRRKSDQN